jgi:hypothetical protein
VFGRYRRYSDPDQPFWRQQSWLLSAAFLIVILMLGGTTWLLSGRDSTVKPASVSPLAGNGRPAGCQTDDTDTALPSTAPKDVKWRTLLGGKVPVSAKAGPVLTAGPLLSCFAHTPMGAVLAANVIPTQMSGPDWGAVVEQQLVPGSGQEIFMRQRSNVPQSTQNGNAGNTYAGFAINSYTPEAATVQLLIRSGTSTTYMSTVVTVGWSGGDWKVWPGRTGSLFGRVQSVTGNSGFLMWGV